MGLFGRSKKKDWVMGHGVYDTWVSRYEGKETEVVVPNFVDGMDSSGSAFRDVPIEKLVLNEKMKWLEGDNLKGHPTLRELVWTDYVLRVMGSALQNCTNLQQITVGPPNVDRHALPVNDPQTRKHGLEFTTGDFRMEGRALSGCTSLEYLEIPANIAWVYGNFPNCSKLAFVWVPGSVIDLGDMRFSDSPYVVLYTDGNPYLEKYASENSLPCKVVASRQDMRDEYRRQFA